MDDLRDPLIRIRIETGVTIPEMTLTTERGASYRLDHTSPGWGFEPEVLP
jgi:hypothetical protein